VMIGGLFLPAPKNLRARNDSLSGRPAPSSRTEVMGSLGADGKRALRGPLLFRKNLPTEANLCPKESKDKWPYKGPALPALVDQLVGGGCVAGMGLLRATCLARRINFANEVCFLHDAKDSGPNPLSHSSAKPVTNPAFGPLLQAW